MKTAELERENGKTESKRSISRLRNGRDGSELSVTKQEIAMFWRKKRIDEEDHLLAAIKAVARIRARNLTEEEYKQFEEDSLKDVDSKHDNKQLPIGIKDWWTKSRYAYLNQPAIKTTADYPRRRNLNHVPNCSSFKPTSLRMYPSLGVF